MKYQAEGLKANGVCGFAFTPSTTAFDLLALPVIAAKIRRGGIAASQMPPHAS
jgi:hypothetical protein